ncbi:MAG: hypothetical protein R3C61_01505 [Bacteroidia bacterium]
MAEEHLNYFFRNRDSIYVEVIEKNGGLPVDTIEAMQDPEKRTIIERVVNSKLSASDLNALLDAAEELDSIDKLLNQAKELQEEQRNFNYLLRLGSTVEEQVKKALEGIGVEMSVQHQGMGAFDFVVRNPSNGREFFLELKSFEHQSQRPLRFAPSQAEKAQKNEPNYAICLLRRPDDNNSLSEEYVHKNLFFKKQIGTYFSDGYGDYLKLQSIKNSSKESRLHVVLLGDERIEVDLKPIIDQSLGFADLTAVMLTYLRGE